VSAEAEDAVDAKPRKKTRRGTRGGRGRKKPAAAGNGADAAVDAVVDAATAEPELAPVAPVPDGGEYVPMSEWIDDLDGR
jgi:hypothetical protein